MSAGARPLLVDVHRATRAVRPAGLADSGGGSPVIDWAWCRTAVLAAVVWQAPCLNGGSCGNPVRAVGWKCNQVE